ncbi:HEAT repeat domain-containing protein [Allomuricauda sp. d1]|uniref:HEAT repeat domain-containing protein n=1 Tax=Allomuricauda sp. d1 TaxID=3136725 RepID=UPI0031E00525
MTLLFSVLGALYFLGIFYFRNKISFRSKRLVDKKKELAPVISNFLFHDPSAPIVEKKEYVELKINIRNELGNPAFRKILTEILVDLQKDVAGETRERLNELYYDLNLHLDAYKKLNSWRWEVVSQGILELTQMKVVDAYSFITKFINDKRSTIRKQAEIATVSLRAEGIAHFLDTTRYSISEWQQLKLIETLRTIEHFRPPNFKAWLISSNRDVVLFSLRLIKHYNQNDAITAIIELLKHKDDRIKTEAINCIKEFCVIKAIPILKAIYWKTSEIIKIEILDAIATLGSEDDIEFLQKVAKKESGFILKNKVAMAINDIAPDTVLPTKDIIPQNKLSFEAEEQSVFGDESALKEEVKQIADSETNTVEPELTEEEVGEIEVYEVDTETIFTANEKETRSVDENVAEDTTESTFEIGPVPEELDESINAEIGLLTDLAQEEEIESLQNKGFEKAYSEMEVEEKDKFVDAMHDTASQSDIPLLEEIMEDEPNSELRFRIFKIIKSLGRNTEKPTIETAPDKEIIENHTQFEGTPKESIFHDLLDYASDLESKIILLEQMAELGDEKELPLLFMLLDDEDAIIQKKAEKTKSIILLRLNGEGSEKSIPIESNGDMLKEDEKPMQTVAPENEIVPLEHQKELLPLELCFLYDELDISPPEEDHLRIDFDFTEEFYQAQQRRAAIKE